MNKGNEKLARELAAVLTKQGELFISLVHRLLL